MPRDLPGLYWDEARNRYFPLSSKPKQSPELPVERSADSQASSHRNLKRKRGNTLWSSSQRWQSSVLYSERERCKHEMLRSQWASTSQAIRSESLTMGASVISAFRTATTGDVSYTYLGDSNGWFYSLDHERVSMSFTHPNAWDRQLSLASEISSICTSGTTCVATSFGPDHKILVREMASTDMYILGLGNKTAHDVRTSHFRSRSLVLGAQKHAVFIKDIDTDVSRTIKILDTQSDVFAVHQEENLVYTGARNGETLRFDLRTHKPQGLALLDGIANGRRPSATYLNIIRDWQLLVARIDGSLATFDLRFAQSQTPLMTIIGHVNSYIPDLPVALDPSADFVFAAGQDCKLRGWSLRTGAPLIGGSSPGLNPFANYDFKHPIRALQVVQEQNNTCMWAAAGQEMYKFYLGQRHS